MSILNSLRYVTASCNPKIMGVGSDSLQFYYMDADNEPSSIIGFTLKYAKEPQQEVFESFCVKHGVSNVIEAGTILCDCLINLL